jgi:hemerythrin-like domain-containing protein
MTARDGRPVKPIAANTAARKLGRTRARPPAPDAQAAIDAIRTLKDEHLAIASVLFGLRQAVGRIREGVAAPDFVLLRAMLDYVVAFPERLHHPKESRYLFGALAARHPPARPLIDELESEHVRGAASIESLRSVLDGYERDRNTLDALVRAVDDYARFHWQHMEKEESVLLPLASRHLVAADWERIAGAFRDNDNPLRGIQPKGEVDALYRRILGLMPAARKPASRPGAPR